MLDDRDAPITEVWVEEVYVTILTEDQGIALTKANKTSIGEVNQAYYDLKQEDPTPMEKITELLKTLMKGASTVGTMLGS